MLATCRPTVTVVPPQEAAGMGRESIYLLWSPGPRHVKVPVPPPQAGEGGHLRGMTSSPLQGN